MPPPNYSKKKNAELDELLHLRGLQTGSTKIEKISRLVKQDQEDENARKATEAKVKAASNTSAGNANAAGQHDWSARSDAGQGALEGNRKRNAGMSLAKKKARAKKGKAMNVGNDQRDGQMDSDDQDAFIKGLMAGRSDAAGRGHSGTGHTQHTNTNVVPGIIVNMTPKGTRGSTSISTPTGLKLRRLAAKNSRAQSAKDGSRTLSAAGTGEEEKGSGLMIERVAVGAVLVFVGILGTVLLMEMAVKWYIGVGRG